MSLSSRRVIRHSSLTIKQAALTLIIAVMLSIIAGALELAWNVRDMRKDINEQTCHNLALIHATAAEAAFQLNPDLAEQVVAGLFAAGSVQQVIIRDDFGRIMGQRQQLQEGQTSWLVQHLFSDIIDHRITLEYDMGPGNPAGSVGELELTLALDSLGQAFLERSVMIFSLSVLKAFAIAALVVALFHIFITRPLLKVHKAIAATDPLTPGAWPKPRLKYHDQDELGELVESLDGLLGAFQHGLDQRDQLHQISTLDGLTGIANRRRFDLFLSEAWQSTYHSGQPLSVIFIDIDNFKAYNDHYGHTMGDDTLRAVAHALSIVVTRPGDLVARYGGEEFVCVLTDTDLKGAHGVALRIKQAILELNIAHDGHGEHDQVTASLGVASTRPAQGEMTLARLLALADQRLYRAKDEGRNKVA
ncbi:MULTISPECIES: sensor domain-containing diguanylate cyclase [Halomonadaceae]|uniref:GGDEF domain-containing protein n=1 Tax=Halomonadaceae TaxID=28256 RepID=UPI00159A349A|nr:MULTISPECIES: sensor domain-containing diguanylate cyclase [Halomonas]QJQ94552.1 diguanylate cyclase [Halomonas sp. PA5]